MAKTNHSQVLLVAIDDDPTSLDLLTATLESDDLRILSESDPRRGLELIEKHRPQIVISDLMMPHLTGMDVLERVMALDPTIDVILLTAHYSTEAAVEAVQKGACDYLNKPISTSRLRERVLQLAAKARARIQARRLDDEMVRVYRFQNIVSRSPLMMDLLTRIERIAPHYRTVLVNGPTGSGKELVSRALHELSPVSSGPFVVCNCAAIPDSLVESELFGHVRGAFTGATQDKPGLFEAAHGGTLMLDEVGEMPLPAQAKLLRAVQQQEIQRVGSTAIKKVNVRIIAATHRNLRAMAAEGTFREDLFFRLGMVQVMIPPLADRKEDLPLLFRHFIQHFAELYNKPLQGLTRRAEMVLTRHCWPGNVRELEGVIGSAAMMAEDSLIDVADLPPQLHEVPVAGAEIIEDQDTLLSLAEVETQHAKRVLARMNGDKVRTAEILGVSRATLYRLLAR